MRHIFGIAVAAAVLLATPRAADAALVTGFRLGTPNTPVSIGGTTITTIPVTRVNGANVSSSSPVVTEISSSGLTISTFTASFSSTVPLDLVAFDFGFETLGPDGSYSGQFEADGVSLALPVPPATGTFSGVGTSSANIDLAGAGLTGITTGSIEITLTNAVFNSSMMLPNGFQGFSSVTAVPEPSTVVGLALLSGLGLIVHRRRRLAQLG